jgi:repressor LexA
MPRSKALTPRQLQIFEFIKDKVRNRGYGPTVREIGDNYGISSPNGVMCHLRALVKKGLITRQNNLSRAIEMVNPNDLKRTALPLAGTVAAGTPVLAVRNNEVIDFANLFTDSHQQFCLRVTGESMIEDHIADGDFVIIRSQNTARDGDIVVALVDKTEATLKRFYREKDRIRLEPSNSKMKPIYATDVQILGVLIGVVRTY